ncbi:M48 family metallopeptidase [Jannaschia sp. Os4]|uniref:M48 family metallopeptidase n=1 Tax=Jannaschia sp. Os4 TaxID=2807617 RepID=UPI001939B2F3|nr:M48 family metallopeptidase [Jannaschia sp. Os4]MBM2577251.1 M48 family metallopeptidase [Jannaschia sp. Os4]
MIKAPALLIALAYGLVVFLFSSWRMKRKLDSEAEPLDEPLMRDDLRAMADALDLPEVRVNVLPMDPVNGLAAPDGRIFITSGFLRKLRAGEVSSAEMASVVAHELGHVALGHARRRMIDFSGQNAIRVALAGVLGRVLPFGVGIWAANAVASLVAARLSRQDEYEADAYASALLVKAGIGVEPQKSLFRKLERMTGMGGNGMPAWMMSHPKPDERIAAIDANAARWGIGGRG